MASEYWGVNRGQHLEDVVMQASLPSKDVIVTVDLSKSLVKSEVITLLESLVSKIMQSNWPPA